MRVARTNRSVGQDYIEVPSPSQIQRATQVPMLLSGQYRAPICRVLRAFTKTILVRRQEALAGRKDADATRIAVGHKGES